MHALQESKQDHAIDISRTDNVESSHGMEMDPVFDNLSASSTR